MAVGYNRSNKQNIEAIYLKRVWLRFVKCDVI